MNIEQSTITRSFYYLYTTPKQVSKTTNQSKKGTK